MGASEYEAAELKGVVRGLHIMCSSCSYTNHPVLENIYNSSCMSVSKSLKLPVSKHRDIICHMLFQYIIYCIIFSLYIFFFQEYKTQLEMAIEDRWRL